jgi:hypothetical protein
VGKSGKPGKTPSESFHMPVDETRWRIFIETVRKTGSLRKGATAASPHQVSGERHGCVSSFVNLAKRDPQKAQELEAAISEALGNLEATIYDHAVNGTERPIFQGGVQVGKEIQFDHRTALEILRRHDRPGESARSSSRTPLRGICNSPHPTSASCHRKTSESFWAT